MVSLTKRMTHRMLRLAFSETDQQALHYERYHHPHPRVQQRMSLWLKVRVYRITRSHNCAPSLPIPCDPISSCITQAVWKR